MIIFHSHVVLLPKIKMCVLLVKLFVIISLDNPAIV